MTMPGSFNAESLRHFLVVLILVAGQSLALAHGVDEASIPHPAETVCDLCIASQPLGAAAGGSAAVGFDLSVAGDGLLPDFHPLAPKRAYLTPGQRAPPVSC
jgi:hypothetical protein